MTLICVSSLPAINLRDYLRSTVFLVSFNTCSTLSLFALCTGLTTTSGSILSQSFSSILIFSYVPFPNFTSLLTDAELHLVHLSTYSSHFFYVLFLLCTIPIYCLVCIFLSHDCFPHLIPEPYIFQLFLPIFLPLTPWHSPKTPSLIFYKKCGATNSTS